jgi:hypothetical protein
MSNVASAEMMWMTFVPRRNDWRTALWMSANHVCILLLIRHYCFNDFCFTYPTEFGHFRITYVGGNRVVNVPTIPDHHLLGECCLFKLSIPGECSLVVSSINSEPTSLTGGATF